MRDDLGGGKAVHRKIAAIERALDFPVTDPVEASNQSASVDRRNAEHP